MTKEVEALKCWEWKVIKQVYRCHLRSTEMGMKSSSTQPSEKHQSEMLTTVPSTARTSGSESWPHQRIICYLLNGEVICNDGIFSS